MKLYIFTGILEGAKGCRSSVDEVLKKIKLWHGTIYFGSLSQTFRSMVAHPVALGAAEYHGEVHSGRNGQP